MGEIIKAFVLSDYIEWVTNTFEVYNLKTEIVDSVPELSYTYLPGLSKTVVITFINNHFYLSSVVIYNDDELSLVQEFKNGLGIEEDSHNCGFFQFKVSIELSEKPTSLIDFHKFIGFKVK